MTTRTSSDEQPIGERPPAEESTTDSRLAALEERLVKTQDELVRAREALESVTADRDRLVHALHRGRIPVAGREVEVQPALSREERKALAWLVEQRRQARR